ncbi:MAG: cation:proton antiporter [Actinomycetia bacterium]|nr:cation:proton antiporter [Actinomycetes bacterium]
MLVSTLVSPSHHELLVFWVQLLVLFTGARSLGWVARKLGQPAVVGHLLAGLVLGPSVFGKLWPGGFEWFLPPDDKVQSGMLLAIGWVGAGLLLLTTGFETDLGLIGRLGRAAALVTVGSLVVPAIGGLAVGVALPDEFLGADTTRLVFTLFMGLALSVSALAVVAKILAELGLMRRDFGQITVAAGMANDIVGWLVLGVISGLAVSGEVSVLEVLVTLVSLTAVLVGSLTIGQRLVDGALREVRRHGSNVEGALVVIFATLLVLGVITQAIGVEAVLGAFVAGVVLMRSRYRQEEAHHHIESLTHALFAPLFFATAGLRIDLGLLSDPTVFGWTLVVIAAAIGLKFLGAYAGARFAGLSPREGVALGGGLNARGALEIIIATVGLSLGVLSETAFTVIVLVPIVSSAFASAVLRMVAHNWEGSISEQERLKREAVLYNNLLVRSGRMLLPSRGFPNSVAAAQVIHFAWPEEGGATVLAIGDETHPPDMTAVTNVLFDRQVDEKVIAPADAAGEILTQARLGYGVIAFGARDTREDGSLFSPTVDQVLAETDVPVVIVRRAKNLDGRLPGFFTRALVPVAGSNSSRAAQELAFSLSASLGTEIVLSHILNRSSENGDGSHFFDFLPGRRRGGVVELDDPARVAGEKLLGQAVALADELGVRARTMIRSAPAAADEIIRTADELEADLVVVGATLRKLDGRPFLGHRVEEILERANPTVVVAIVPQ